MPENPILSWSFRNRILLGDKKLESDSDQQLLYESGAKKVGLMVLLGSKFTEAESLILRGDGFESSEEAYAAGRLWRQYIAVAFAMGRIGADFDPLPRTSRNYDDRPLDPGAPGLIVFPIKQFDYRTEGWASGSVTRPLQVFLERDLPPVVAALPEGLKDRSDLELAFRMFHLSLQFDNVEIKYILLVTALESLIPDAKPLKDDEKLVAAFDELIAYAKRPGRFAKQVRERIISSLAFAKQESIINLGVKLVEEKLVGRQYNGLSPVEYFRRAYNYRNILVHGALPDGAPLDRELIFRDLDTLRQFVADLLAAEAGHADPHGPARPIADP